MENVHIQELNWEIKKLRKTLIAADVLLDAATDWLKTSGRDSSHYADWKALESAIQEFEWAKLMLTKKGDL